MLDHCFDIRTATPVDLIKAQILEGLARCRPIDEIATDIADLLAHDAKTSCKDRAQSAA